MSRIEPKVRSRRIVLSDQARNRFAALLTHKREARGWSQAELARQAGLARDSIHGYESTDNLPSPQSLRKIAQALLVKPSELIPNMTDDAFLPPMPVIGASDPRADRPFAMAMLPDGNLLVHVHGVLPLDAAMKIQAIIEAERKKQELAKVGDAVGEK